ncbi:MAG: hypothetical protein ACJ73S_20750 [Mycobacteriales bacterium]|jgi:hypothetical protein
MKALAVLAALAILAGCASHHGGGTSPRTAGGDWVEVGHEKAYGEVTVHVVRAYDQDCELIVRDQRTSQRLGMTQGESTTILGTTIEVLTTRRNAGVTLHVTPPT